MKCRGKKEESHLRGSLRQELLRVMMDWKIYAAIAVFVTTCTLICEQNGTRSAVASFQHTVMISNVSYLLILIAAFPTACIFCDDWLGNYIRPAVVRSGGRCYIYGKIIICVFSTFLVSFIGWHIYLCIELLRKPMGIELVNVYAYQNLIKGDFPFVYLTIQVLIYSMAISIYSLYGILLSAILPNRFVAVMAPLLMNICMEEISYEFPKMFRLYTLETGGAFLKNGILGNIVFSAMIVCGYCIIAGGLFYRIVRRRIRNEIV